MQNRVWSIENFQNAKWLSGKRGCPLSHFLPPPTLLEHVQLHLGCHIDEMLSLLGQLSHMKLGGATPYLLSSSPFPKLEVRVYGVAPGQRHNRVLASVMQYIDVAQGVIQ